LPPGTPFPTTDSLLPGQRTTQSAAHSGDKSYEAHQRATASPTMSLVRPLRTAEILFIAIAELAVI